MTEFIVGTYLDCRIGPCPRLLKLTGTRRDVGFRGTRFGRHFQAATNCGFERPRITGVGCERQEQPERSHDESTPQEITDANGNHLFTPSRTGDVPVQRTS